MAPADPEPAVVKHYPNGFRATTLLETLQHETIENLVICGVMSHMCIDVTTRAAFDFGFTCTVAQDACATRDLEFNRRVVNAADVHAAFMAALGAVYAKVTTAREIMEGLA